MDGQRIRVLNTGAQMFAALIEAPAGSGYLAGE